jgi:prohibitin 2
LGIVIKAEGEARSAELIGRAIVDNPGFVQLRKIDAAKDIANTLSKSANTVYLSADSLLLNLVSETKTDAASKK